MASNERYDVPWALSSEHCEWRELMREFTQREIAPGALKRGTVGGFDDALIGRLAELGVCGLLVPEAFGGSGADLTTLCIAIEAIAECDSSIAATVHVQAISAALFAHLANDEQREKYLPGFATGDAFVAFGLTEPSGGSDAGDIATRARRDGSDWVIDGSKQFITNSGTPRSSHVILFAASGEGARRGRPEVTSFLVPLDAPGVEVGPAYEKLGWRGSDTHPLFFEGVRVPDVLRLGEPGRGYREALRFLSWARMPIAAMAVGLAQGCLDASREFIDGRESFGQPLGSHQGVAFALAEIAALVASARVMTYDAAYKYDHDLPIENEAAISKLVASEAANKAAYKASQIHGGYGFIEDSPVARHLRDARILTVGEGTSEVQKLLIARRMGLPL
jgi:alkylation response protein AidB-like acyl-CoA dehydrogenase